MTGIKREYVFSTYVQSSEDKDNDALFVKEILHHPDGRTKRNFRMIRNYQKPFYVTLPDYKNHNSKKEFEEIGKLGLHTSNQAKLAKAANFILTKQQKRYVSLREVSDSPYLYGTDVSTPVLLAQEYKVKYPNLLSDSSRAIMDFEWDVVNGTEAIISGVLSFNEKLHIAVTKTFLGELSSTAEEAILISLNTHLKEHIESRNIIPIISIVNTPADVVIALVNSAHKWSPDFLGFWNIKGDMEKMLSALKDSNINPALVFSDPSVPNEYKYFNWKEDQLIKTTSAGKSTPKLFVDLWHTVQTPSSFYFICLMALFRTIRNREQQRTSYSLDSVLSDYLNLKKLRFDYIPKGLSDLDWHKEMQTNHKIDYITYMAFDGISVELLDEKTNDVSKTLRAITGISELSTLKSRPKCLSDSLHFDLLENNRVIGSTGKNMVESLDTETPSIKNWIGVLASELEYNIGCSLINEYPNLHTNITTHSFDIDVRSAYPESEICLNVGKSTRAYELCGITGLNTEETRTFGINLTNVKTNCLSLAHTAFGFPKLDDLLKEFTK
jgi:hypothetical protein